MPDKKNTPRYFVVFTPVGWQVRDREDSGGEVRGYGTGHGEYQRAKDYARALNGSVPAVPQSAASAGGEDGP